MRNRPLSEEGEGGPSAGGGERERLLGGEGIGELTDEIGDPRGARGNPVGSAGGEAEPVGLGAAGDDAVDGLLEAAHAAGAGVGRVEVDLDQLGAAVGGGEAAAEGGGGGED